MAGSWLTTAFGVSAILGAILQLIAYTVEEGGMPHDTSTWINFGTKVVVGVGLILAKSFNTSNAPSPVAAHVVSATDAAKHNPSAPKT